MAIFITMVKVSTIDVLQLRDIVNREPACPAPKDAYARVRDFLKRKYLPSSRLLVYQFVNFQDFV